MTPEESRVMSTAESTVDRLVKAVRWYRYAVILLSVVVLGLIAGAFGLRSQANSTQDLSRRIQQGAIAGCRGANEQRTADARLWDAFIGLLVSNPGSETEYTALQKFRKTAAPASADPATWDAFLAIFLRNLGPSPVVQNEARQFEAVIASANQPRNCQQVYGKS